MNKQQFNLILRDVVISFLLFWLGAWLFNHLPVPFFGIVIALAYPLFRIYHSINRRLK